MALDRALHFSGDTHLVAISGSPCQRNSKFNASTCKSVTGLSSSVARCLSCFQVSGETLLRTPLYAPLPPTLDPGAAPIGCCATSATSLGFLAAMSRNDGRFAIVTPLPLQANAHKLLPKAPESPLPPYHTAPSQRRSFQQERHA